MKNFIEESIQEFEQVSWPTEKETRTYLWYNIYTIVFVTILLSVIGMALSKGLVLARAQFPHATIAAEDTPATQQELDQIINNLQASGATITPATTIEPTTTPVAQ